MKIIILSLTVFDNSTYSKFYNTQVSTWDSVNVEDITTMYYVGNATEDKIDNNIIYTKVEESIFNVGHKTLKAFELSQNIPYDIIYRTNSSSYVDKILLKEFFSNQNINSIYGGVKGNYSNLDFASGSGYFISKNLVNYVLENQNFWNHELIDDVALSQVLKRQNVQITPAPRFDILTSTDFIPMDFFHYRIKNEDRNDDCNIMNKLHILKNEFHNR